MWKHLYRRGARSLARYILGEAIELDFFLLYSAESSEAIATDYRVLLHSILYLE